MTYNIVNKARQSEISLILNSNIIIKNISDKVNALRFCVSIKIINKYDNYILYIIRSCRYVYLNKFMV